MHLARPPRREAGEVADLSPVDSSMIDGDVTVITDGSTGFTVTAEVGGSTSYPLDE